MDESACYFSGLLPAYAPAAPGGNTVPIRAGEVTGVVNHGSGVIGTATGGGSVQRATPGLALPRQSPEQQLMTVLPTLSIRNPNKPLARMRTSEESASKCLKQLRQSKLG
jgi:hypothetical protein